MYLGGMSVALRIARAKGYGSIGSERERLSNSRMFG